MTTDDDWPERLAERVTAATVRRERAAAVRQQFATRRTPGKAARHRDREKIMTERIHQAQEKATAERTVRCRYLRRNDEQCTGEVLDPNADVLLCGKHVARAMRLVQITLPRR